MDYSVSQVGFISHLLATFLDIYFLFGSRWPKGQRGNLFSLHPEVYCICVHWLTKGGKTGGGGGDASLGQNLGIPRSKSHVDL